MTRWGRAGLVVCLATGLAGCDPALPRAAGVVMDAAGSVSVVTTGCPDDPILSVTVDEEAVESPRSWKTFSRVGTPGTESVTILAPPPGWGLDEATLTALQPRRTYTVTVVTGHDDLAVRFSLDDLRAVPPGRVWTVVTGSAQGAVPAAEFAERNRRACGRDDARAVS
jgi:hypothetical protein